MEWTRRDFREYDVEADAEANARMIALNRGGRNVPVLMEDGRVIQAGWQGRSCVVGCAVAGATNLTPEHRRIGGDG
ncbi:MAG TPA: glutaredoxin [Terracidiphilus sp.]|nr:glutaredoxin [Terracidiphilus sp.]